MRPQIPTPCLCLVTDLSLCNGDPKLLVGRVAGAVAGGVDLVQLREKSMPSGRLLELALKLRQATLGSALLFVNDRVDVAVACEADGVQLGESAMPISSARKVAGDGTMLIGRSVHTLDEAKLAEEQGADLLVVGSIFPTGSHPAAEVGGTQLLSGITAAARIPVLGIGGIDAGNVAEVIGAGAHGAAVIRAILGSENPEQAARQIKGAMSGAWEQREFSATTRQA